MVSQADLVQLLSGSPIRPEFVRFVQTLSTSEKGGEAALGFSFLDHETTFADLRSIVSLAILHHLLGQVFGNLYFVLVHCL